MRQPFVIALAVPILALTAGVASAQEEFEVPPSHHAPGVAPYNSTLRRTVTLGEQLVFEREMANARQRNARIQRRKWLGISLQRPTDTTGFGTNNVYQYRAPAGHGYPFASWYAPPRIVTGP